MNKRQSKTVSALIQRIEAMFAKFDAHKDRYEVLSSDDEEGMEAWAESLRHDVSEADGYGSTEMDSISEVLGNFCDALQEIYDRKSSNWQESDKGNDLRQEIDALESAADATSNAADMLRSANMEHWEYENSRLPSDASILDDSICGIVDELHSARTALYDIAT